MDEQFWIEVAQAYAKVNSNEAMKITVERDNKQARVLYDGHVGGIVILVTEVDTSVVEPLPLP
jgi:hypothetical protein